MNFKIHYSKNILGEHKPKNEELRNSMSDFWAYAIVEADNREQAIQRLVNEVGEEKFNYVLSATPC